MADNTVPRPQIHLIRMGLALLAAAVITPLCPLMSQRCWNSCRTRLRGFAKLAA